VPLPEEGRAVSIENVELIRALQPGPEVDVASVLADEVLVAQWIGEVVPFFAPDVQGTMRFPGMAPVTYTGGIEGLAEAWRDWLRSWNSYRFEVEDVLDGGDKVVVVKIGRGRQRPAAPESSLRRAAIWTVTDGLITRVDFNVPYEEALSSIGLASQPELG
jgi:ketosteroid isomerase-like protein